MDWRVQCQEWLKKYDPVKPEMLGRDVHHYGFVRRLSEKLPANAIIVSDTGGNVIMVGHAFRSKQGQRIFSSNANSPMGFSMCGAIGAWFAAPERPVICLLGDGGFQFNSQELQTIKHYGVKIKVFILNNFFLANTALYQLQNGKKPLACGPDGYSVPDFSAVAKAYGLFAAHVSGHAGNQNIIDIVLGMDEPVVCDVQHPYFCDFQPRMALWNAGIEEQFPPLPEDEFRANMLIDPIPGWEERRKQYKELPDEFR